MGPVQFLRTFGATNVKMFCSLWVVFILSGAALADGPQRVEMQILVDHPEKYLGKTIIVKGVAKRKQTDDENQKLFLLYGHLFTPKKDDSPPSLSQDREFHLLIEGMEDFSQDFHGAPIEVAGIVGEPTAPPAAWGFKRAKLVTIRKAKILTEFSEVDIFGNFDLNFLVAYPTKYFGKEVQPDTYVGKKIQVQGWASRSEQPDPTGKLFLIHGDDKNKKILVEGIESFAQSLNGKNISISGTVGEPTEPPKNWGFDRKLPVVRNAKILGD